MLDSVRAARDMPNTGASNRFAVWGHSQEATPLSIRERLPPATRRSSSSSASRAAAPATYLVELFDADESTEQDLLAMSVLSWTRLENVPVANVVEPQAMSAFEKTAQDCIEIGRRIREDRNGRVSR